MLATLEESNVRLRMSMLDAYLHALAVKGDTEGVDKLFEWKCATFSRLEDIVRLEEELVSAAVFGDFSRVEKTVAALHATDGAATRPIVNTLQ